MLNGIKSLKLSPQTEQMLGFGEPLPPETIDKLVKQGLWWIQPLFRARGYMMVGILLRPNVALEDAPIVVCNEGVAVTVASSCRTALPMMIYSLKLAGMPDRWQRFRDRWASLESELQDFENILGGSGGLQRFTAVLDRDDLIAADNDNGPHKERRQARLEILEILDPDTQHVSFRRWLNPIISEELIPQDLPEDFGAWNQQALVAHFLAEDPLLIGDRNPETLSEVVWRLLTRPASLDTSNSQPPEHFFYPITIGSQTAGQWAADVLNMQPDWFSSKTYQDHPLWRASKLIAQDRDGYTGMPHVEAAALLDEAGKPEQAYDSLISAAFWSMARYKETLPPILEAARYMAEQNGWNVITQRLAKIPSSST
jgi:hypothetical protein